MNSNHVSFAVMSLLIVAIVPSSVLKASALPPDPHFGGSCWIYHNQGLIVKRYANCCWHWGLVINCQTCEIDENNSVVDHQCSEVETYRSLPGGITGGPQNLTNTQNGGPITLPGGNTHGPPSTSNAPPSSNATTGNPSLKGTTGSHSLPVSKGGSSTVPNNTILSTHHHKARNLGQTSGSTSTGNSTGH